MAEKRKTVLFYDPILEDIKAQKFYQIDFNIIKENGYELIVTDRFSDLFKWWKYDILFIYFYTYGAFRALVARFLGKSVYFTGGIDALNSSTSSNNDFLIQKLFFLVCYFFSTKCIIVSDNDWNNIKKVYKGKIQKKLVKSYHVIDVDKYYSEENNRKKIFVSICWQGYEENVIRKGVDSSLGLFKHLISKEEFKDYKYEIIGKFGGGTKYLKGCIESLDLADSVLLRGEVTEEYKVSLLKRAKYYFQLSTYEGFGLAALEALAAGDIVIHSGNGGLKYVVGEDGIQVNRDRVENEYEVVYNKIISFDTEKLKSAQERVKRVFSYNIRKEQFDIIFKFK